jgi:hypothetical protein
MHRYKATTALPVVHLYRATNELRQELRRTIQDDGTAGEVPDWSTLCVVGPVEIFDVRGGIRFEYRGSVRCRRSSDLTKTRVAV